LPRADDGGHCRAVGTAVVGRPVRAARRRGTLDRAAAVDVQLVAVIFLRNARIAYPNFAAESVPDFDRATHSFYPAGDQFGRRLRERDAFRWKQRDESV